MGSKVAVNSDSKISFTCSQCNHFLKAPVILKGERVNCPECNGTIRIPRKSSVIIERKTKMIRCDYCHFPIKVEVGKHITTCPKCLAKLSVPLQKDEQ
ncbi:MAG: hypothetical protein HQK84_10575 [Nitrospinae bacterium]|nr:hypothetical protein [Nitrospinota bacterium]